MQGYVYSPHFDLKEPDFFWGLTAIIAIVVLGLVVYMALYTPIDTAGFFQIDPGAWLSDPGMAP